MPTSQPSSSDDWETRIETVTVPDANHAPALVRSNSDCGEFNPVPPVENSEAKLIVERSTDARMVGKVVTVHRLPFVLGRRDCDLTFEEAQGVSKKHAQITVQDGVFFITDTGSLNHTFVDEV